MKEIRNQIQMILLYPVKSSYRSTFKNVLVATGSRRSILGLLLNDVVAGRRVVTKRSFLIALGRLNLVAAPVLLPEL
jgi:hypothetical protein